LPAKLTLASVLVLSVLLLPGRAVCPFSWSGGPVDAVAWSVEGLALSR
jgi:hypothetical protein